MKKRIRPIKVGDTIFDHNSKEWAKVDMIIEMEGGRNDYRVTSTDGDRWMVRDEDAYQLAEGRRFQGEFVCHEHNETQDDYPYYCPERDENCFGFETEKVEG